MRLLSDQDLDAELASAGHTVTPLLLPDEVDALRSAAAPLVGEGGDGTVVDYMRTDRRPYREAVAALTEVWSQALPRAFGDVDVVMTTFVVKHPGPDSAMYLHDDRTFVDERRFRAATVWVPLVDTGPSVANGGLAVVPRSHLLPTGWSGSLTPDVIRPWEGYLRDRLEPVEAPAGTAVVYDARTLHASGANLGGSPRVAAVCAVVPAGSPMVHVVATGRRSRVVHAVDASFYADHHPREVEAAMPDRFPVVERLDDPVALRADDLARVFGPSPAPTSVPPVPDDLAAGQAPPPGRLTVRPGVVADGGVDLPLRAADLAGGPAAVVPLRPWRHHVPRPLRRFRSHLVVVDPGGRVQLDPGRELVVVEAPTVGAGARTPDAVAALDIGDALTLGPGVTTVWNQGPGPLVGVLR